MDKFVDQKDALLLEKDRYTFFVLSRVMSLDCELLLSDHEQVIICYTCKPYPVWIWTKDNLTIQKMNDIYLTVKEYGLFDKGLSFILKYELAEYFIDRRNGEYHVDTNMLAYECINPIEPDEKCDGKIYQCQMSDLEEVSEFIKLMNEELKIDQKSIDEYHKDAKLYIESGNVYFWKNKQGINVASCKYDPEGDLASINLVYTKKEHRRKHYAENLVYNVTKIANNKGYIPMLYTDADYEASNKCYKKIGYTLKGRLCTISKINNKI